MAPPVRGHSSSNYSSSYVPPRRGDEPTSADVHRFSDRLNQQVLGGRATGQGGLAPTETSAMISGYEAQGGAVQANYRSALRKVADGTMSSRQAIDAYGIDSSAQRRALAQVSNGTLDLRSAAGVQGTALGRAETRVPLSTTTAAGHGSSPYQESSHQQPAYPAASYQPSSGSAYGSSPYQGSSYQQSAYPAAGYQPPSGSAYGSSPYQGSSYQQPAYPAAGYQPPSGSAYGSYSSTEAQPPSTQRPSSSSSDYASDFFTQAQDPTRFASRPDLPGQYPPDSYNYRR